MAARTRDTVMSDNERLSLASLVILHGVCAVAVAAKTTSIVVMKAIAGEVVMAFRAESLREAIRSLRASK